MEHDVFLEISPHPILLSSIQQELSHAGKEGAVLPSLRREEEESTVLAGSLGALYTHGYPMEWSRLYPAGGRSVQLPSYPWQRERCWLDQPAIAIPDQSHYASLDGAGKRSVLGRHFKSAQAETHFWETVVDGTTPSSLDDHRVEGIAVLPAALYVEMVLEAAAEAFSSQSFVLKDIEFRKALFLSADETRTIQVILSADADTTASVHIYSRPHDAEQPDRSWTLHATAVICLQQNSNISRADEQERPAEVQARCSEQISGKDYYVKLRESGIDYGPAFQSISHLWRRDGEMLSELEVPDWPHREFVAGQFHPAILDACFQTLGASVADEATGSQKQGAYMPTHVDEIRIGGRPGPHLWSHAHLQEQNADTVKGEVRLLDETGHVAVEMLGLRFDNIGCDTKRVSEQDPDNWLYEFHWQLSERPDAERAPQPSAPVSRGNWLIFADRGGVGEALEAVLNAQGDASILVARGESYERTDSSHFRVRPERPEDVRQLLEAVLAADQPICRGIVHLWSLDARPPTETTVASLEEVQTLGCRNVLGLVQELARVERHHFPRLWLITRGAQPAGEECLPLDAAQAPLWGLGRVIAQEHPMLWGGLIDLDASLSDGAAHQLWKEISASDGEDQIAFRRGRRFAARLVRKPKPAAPQAPLSWRTDGSYLITGGLGDLGLCVAHWMVEQGARRLILLARTKLPPRAHWNSAEAGSRLAHQIAAIRRLEALGASVHLASVDVADEGQLGAFIDEFRTEGWPPIRGVVHAAGVLRDGLLMQLDAAALNAVLRPKMIGGWLLHRLLQDAPLDFFVLFSSAGSLLGQPGQGNYAAANAFLDALAHHRKAQNHPALSINWGAWGGLGFAETTGGQRLAARLALAGIDSIAPAQALEVLKRLLREGSTQVAAVPVDWGRYREFFPAGTQSSLLSELLREQTGNPPQAGHPGEKRSTILAADAAQRPQLLKSYLTELVARVIGQSASKLDAQQPLSNLGLDSLMAVELKNRIAGDLGVNVPMVTFLSGPSVEQAAEQLLHLLTAEPSPSSAPLVEESGERNGEHKNGGGDELLLENLDRYSDEEVNSLLTDLLAKEEVGE
jgi:myxalamid-type polyketide synthase MxaE and MxaD